MKRQLILMLSVLAFAMTASMTSNAQDGMHTPFIEVTGKARIMVKPDEAEIPIFVGAIRQNAKQAKYVVDQASKRIFAIAEKYGIDSKDIDAASINSYPEYEWSKSKRIRKGENVNRTIVLTLKDLSQLAKLSDELIVLKHAQLQSNRLHYSKMQSAQRKVLAKAVLDAKTKANAMLKPLDSEIKGVLSIAESGGRNGFQPVMYAAEMQMRKGEQEHQPAPMIVRDQELVASVRVRFSIDD